MGKGTTFNKGSALPNRVRLVNHNTGKSVILQRNPPYRRTKGARLASR